MIRTLLVLEVIHWAHWIAAFAVWGATQCYGGDIYIGGTPVVPPRLMYFKSKNCIPCKTAWQNIGELGKDWEVTKYKKEGPFGHIIIVDVDEDPDVADEWEVDACPTFVLTRHTDKGWKRVSSYVGIPTTNEISTYYNTGRKPSTKELPR